MSEILAARNYIEIPPDLVEHLPVFDNSWVIRIGLLDVMAGSTRTIDLLEETAKSTPVGEDLEALARVSRQWLSGEDLDVGESGTIYRFFKFASWIETAENPDAPVRKFKKSGSLKTREITDDPSIINLPIEELLLLDGETTQWASVAILLRGAAPDARRLSTEPKYQLSLDAKSHWLQSRILGTECEFYSDSTINNQAIAFLNAIKFARFEYTPLQAEDYCIARAYGLMTAAQGDELWPKLRKHESDRIESMELAIEQATTGKIITVNDHRVVQAIAMRFGLPRARFKYPDCVAKSWPRFWEFRQSAYQQASLYIASY